MYPSSFAATRVITPYRLSPHGLDVERIGQRSKDAFDPHPLPPMPPAKLGVQRPIRGLLSTQGLPEPSALLSEKPFEPVTAVAVVDQHRAVWRSLRRRSVRGPDRRASAASICSAISRSEAFADALRYRLRQIDVDGTEHVSSEIVVTRIGIDVLELRPSFPNPARERFTVQVSVPEATETARLVLYDLLGRPVRSIDALMPGRHELRVNASGVAVTLAAVVPSSGPLRKGNRRLIDEGATPLPGRSALEAFLGDMPVA